MFIQGCTFIPDSRVPSTLVLHKKNKQANKQVIKVKAAIDIHVTAITEFLDKYFLRDFSNV